MMTFPTAGPSIDPGWVLHTVAQLPDEVTSFRRTKAGAIHYGCSKGILNSVYKTLAEVEVEYKLKLKD
jgi:hypothetical protein